MNKLVVYLLLFPPFWAAICTNLSAQGGATIRINEAVSSNSILLDEDADTPDWFELYNYGTDSVSIKDWSISDDPNYLSKWIFPDLVLVPDEYMLVWASGKDRPLLSYATTFVNQGDSFQYLIPTNSVPLSWNTLDFDDSQWARGISGFGYSDGDDATDIPPGTQSVYVRTNFTLTDTTDLQQIILDLDYDDAFVAYINGREVARANIEGFPPAYTAGAITDHEAQIYQGDFPERFIIAEPHDIIQVGVNVLSIQLHNTNGNSTDMTLIPFLSGIFSSPATDGISPPNLLRLSNGRLHTNFKISSESETLFLSNAQAKLIDTLLIQGLLPGTSIGISSVNNNVVFFENTTPGSANEGIGSQGIISSEVDFSHPGGAIHLDVNLVLSGNASDEEIRYTTDSSVPNAQSLLYTGPILITDNTVIRASIFKAGYISSNSNSKTFLRNVAHDLPIVTLVGDPVDLFSEERGFYALGDRYEEEFPFFGANFWENWERPIQFSLYETNGRLGTEFNAGTKIFGGWSRAQDQRSLSIFARGQYGLSEIDYPLFPSRSYQQFQSLVLRNSGQDWLRTMMKDITLTSLMEGTELDFQAYRSTVTYINGQYWGIYHLREKISEHYLASRHKVDADSINLLELNQEVINGNNEDYAVLMDYVWRTDLRSDENFTFIADRIDLDNYILYQLTQVYFNNTDWPANNIKFWNHPGGKWRWILFDTDFGFGLWGDAEYNHDTLRFATEDDGPFWPNPPWSTLLFRKLLKNIAFRNKFINRYADELNTRFLPDNIIKHMESIRSTIASEIPAHFKRWAGNIGAFDHSVQKMRRFARNRPRLAKRHIKSNFLLRNIQQVNIQNRDTAQGYVRLNDHLDLQVPTWQGDYFEDVPIHVEAIPKPGYVFSHWSGGISSTTARVEINLKSTTTLIPNFLRATALIQPIVINEINYNSGVLNPGDWIELYNPNATSLDLSNWRFKDSNDDNIYIIPFQTIIPPKGYLVITRKAIAFMTAFSSSIQLVGDFNFGLSSNGDAIRIYDQDDRLQDEVVYSSSDPWPACANGQGTTLELITPTLDNTLPENWACINLNGSPGRINNFISNPEIPNFTAYPNPVGDYLYLKGLKDQVSLRIFDLSGRLLQEDIVIDGLYVGHLQPGLYIINLIDQRDTVTNFKIVKR